MPVSRGRDELLRRRARARARGRQYVMPPASLTSLARWTRYIFLRIDTRVVHLYRLSLTAARGAFFAHRFIDRRSGCGLRSDRSDVTERRRRSWITREASERARIALVPAICTLRMENGAPFVSDCMQTAALCVIVDPSFRSHLRNQFPPRCLPRSDLASPTVNRCLPVEAVVNVIVRPMITNRFRFTLRLQHREKPALLPNASCVRLVRIFTKCAKVASRWQDCFPTDEGRNG